MSNEHMYACMSMYKKHAAYAFACVGVCMQINRVLIAQENVIDARNLRCAFWDFALNE